MLSSDKNVESIAQLVEMLKEYVGLHKEYLKLDVIDKVVRLLTATALAIVFFLLIIAILLFLSLAIAEWLSTYIGSTGAYFAIAGLHLAMLILVTIFRKSWIERPLVQFLANLLMS